MQLKNTDWEDDLFLMIDLDWIPDNNMEALPCDKVSQAFRHLYVHFDCITSSVSKVVAAVTLFLVKSEKKPLCQVFSNHGDQGTDTM